MIPEKQQKEVEEQILASYEAMYRLAYTYVKNPDEAMDVVQESAYKAISACHKLKDGTAVKSWLFRITANTALDLLRKRSRETVTDTLPEQGQEDVYRDLDTLKALDVLEEKERTVIVLRFFEDMKLQEIAAVTGDNLNSVKSILYRSLKKLKIQLTKGASAS